MNLPLTSEYRAERQALLATLESLAPEEFEHGRTLCEGWAPRDVFAHLLGIDSSLSTYLRSPLNFRKANAALVAEFADLTREELLERGRKWAESPAPHTLLAAPFLIGDLAIHHQDILRGQSRTRTVSPALSAAILREGLVLGGAFKLGKYRIVPTDGGRAFGRGKSISGTREALGLWLSGRHEVEHELTFG